jgi:hypothetical protein
MFHDIVVDVSLWLGGLMYDVVATRRGCSTWFSCVRCVMGNILADWMG